MPRLDSQGFIAQQNQSAQREGDDPRVFYVDNYGGLNIESSPVNIPYADSSDLLNVDISLSGRLRKRGGSVLRNSETARVDGVIIVPVQILTGEWLIWQKVGTAMKGWVCPNKTSNSSGTDTWNFTDLFSASSESEKPSFVVTKESNPRIIMVQPSTVPIEIEVVQKLLVGDGDTTVTAPGDWTSYFGTTYSYAVYGTTTNKLTNISHSGGTTTFTFTSAITSGQQFTLVQPVFHWWAEAIKRSSAQVYGTNMLFNTTAAVDVNVPIPTEIKRGLLDDYVSAGLTNSNLPCLIENEIVAGAASSVYTHDTTPGAATSYAWSNLDYATTASDGIAFGAEYATFGALPASPQALKFIRLSYLPFNGSNYAQGQNIGVFLENGTALTWNNSTNRSATPDTYWLANSSYAVVTSGSPTTICPWIRFDSSSPPGFSSRNVTVVSKEPNTTWVGSSATNTFYTKTSFGSYRPIFGLSDFCNYTTGVFPSIIAQFQDRLVLSGVSSFPNTIWLSNTGDEGSSIPDSRWYNFQIYIEDPTIATNPIQITLDGATEITGVIDWYSSLFVFTKNSVKRVYSPNQTVTPTDYSQSDIGTIGCPSQFSIAKTDRNVVFVSENGLYKVAVLEQTGDYYLESVSIKVRPIFSKGNKFGYNSWIAYNTIDSILYVGVSDGYDPYINNRLLVYYSERESWSEYSLFNGYLPNNHGVCFDGRILIGVVDRVSVTSLTVPTSSTITHVTEFNRYDLTIDLLQPITPTDYNAGISLVGAKVATLIHTVDTNQRVVPLRRDYVPVASSNTAFKFIPIVNYNTQIVAEINKGSGYEEVVETDYSLDVSRQAIRYLGSDWFNGYTLRVRLKDENGYAPVAVVVDNIEHIEGTDYTLTESSEYYNVNAVDTTNANAVVYAGYKYPSYHFTPTFFRQGYRNEKRVTHYIGYYSNKEFVDLFTINDSNTSSGQNSNLLADNYKIRVNVNIAIFYNDSRSGQVTTEIYESDSLIWDLSLFDIGGARFQYNDSVRIVQPIIGVGYSFGVANFSFSTKAFELIGYQVETLTKGKNSRSWL